MHDDDNVFYFNYFNYVWRRERRQVVVDDVTSSGSVPDDTMTTTCEVNHDDEERNLEIEDGEDEDEVTEEGYV